MDLYSRYSSSKDLSPSKSRVHKLSGSVEGPPSDMIVTTNPTIHVVSCFVLIVASVRTCSRSIGTSIRTGHEIEPRALSHRYQQPARDGECMLKGVIRWGRWKARRYFEDENAVVKDSLSLHVSRARRVSATWVGAVPIPDFCIWRG